MQEGIKTCTLDWRHLGMSWTPPLFTFCCLILRGWSFWKNLEIMTRTVYYVRLCA